MEGARNGRCPIVGAQEERKGQARHEARQDAQGLCEPLWYVLLPVPFVSPACILLRHSCSSHVGHEAGTERRLGPLVGLQRGGRCR